MNPTNIVRLNVYTTDVDGFVATDRLFVEQHPPRDKVVDPSAERPSTDCREQRELPVVLDVSPDRRFDECRADPCRTHRRRVSGVAVRQCFGTARRRRRFFHGPHRQTMSSPSR